MDQSNNKYIICDILIHEQMLYQLCKKCHFIRVFTQATRDDWIIKFYGVKGQCSHVIMCWVFWFDWWFPNQCLNATCINYFNIGSIILLNKHFRDIYLNAHLYFKNIKLVKIDWVKISNVLHEKTWVHNFFLFETSL